MGFSSRRNAHFGYGADSGVQKMVLPSRRNAHFRILAHLRAILGHLGGILGGLWGVKMVLAWRRNAHFHMSGLWMAVLRYLGGILGYLRPSWAISGSLSLSLFRAEHCLNPAVPKNMFDISSKLSQESALPVPMLGQVYVKCWFSLGPSAKIGSFSRVGG